MCELLVYHCHSHICPVASNAAEVAAGVASGQTLLSDMNNCADEGVKAADGDRRDVDAVGFKRRTSSVTGPLLRTNGITVVAIEVTYMGQGHMR